MAKSQELVLEKKVVREEVVEVIVEKEEDGEWWEAEITVPSDAVALNFVVRYHATWDNNYGRDYKVLRWCTCCSILLNAAEVDEWVFTNPTTDCCAAPQEVQEL